MVFFSLKFLGEAFSVLTLSSPFLPTNLQWFMFETWFCSSALFLGRACLSAVQQGLVTDVQPQKYLLWDETVFVLLKRYISLFQCSQYFKHIIDFYRGNNRCECTDISKFMQGALHLQRMVSLSGHLFKISSTKYVFQPIEPSNHVHNDNCHSVILSSPLMLMLICFTSDLCCR